MRKTWFHAAAVVAVVLAVPVRAMAMAMDCDSAVVDDTGRIASGDRPAIDEAVKNVEQQGAEVRVRIVADFGGSGYANLDQYEQAVKNACPSWQASSGVTKSNLVIFMLSFNSGNVIKAGLYYGESWKTQLGAQWPSFLKQNVGPAVRGGGVGRGVAVALNGVAGFIRPAATAPSGTVVNDYRKPTDLFGLWIVLGGVLAIAVGVGLFFLFRSRKREREERQTAQQAAQAAKAGCATRIVGFDEASLAVFKAMVNAAAASASEADAASVRAALDAFEEKTAAATVLFGQMQQPQNDPSFDGYSAATYQGIDAAYQRVNCMLDEADAIKVRLQAEVSRLKAIADQAPAKVAAAETSVTEAGASVQAVSEKGFRMPAAVHEHLTAADKHLTSAMTLLQQKRYGEVPAAADAAAAAAGKAKELAQTTGAACEAVIASVAALQKRVEAAPGIIAAEQPTLDALVAAYDESCWRDIRDNLASAGAAVAEAAASVKAASACADLGTQDWDGAKMGVAAVEAALARGNVLLNALAARKTALENARRDTGDDVTTARKTIVAARTYATENPDGIDPAHKGTLDALGKKLDAVEALLKAPKPRWLAAVAAVASVKDEAGKILAAERREHEALVRKRQAAVDALRDAGAAITAAETFINAHTDDVGTAPGVSLAAARRQLQQARASDGLDARIAGAGEAQETAEAALATAKAAHQAAEERREAAALLERERQAELARQERIARQQELDAIAAAEAAQAAIIAASQPRYSPPSYGGGYAPTPSYGGGGYAPATTYGRNDDDNGGGGSISIDTSPSYDSPSDDGGGGSIGFDSSPSSDGGGGSTDI